MKNILCLCAAAVPWLLFHFATRAFCLRINCMWGSYGSWSECDPCTKLQTRSRAMVVYAQFGGNPCSGMRSESRPCETTQGCPLDDGCRDRFRCRSGKCISKSLVCNGDQDCEEDGLDENGCTNRNFVTCEHTMTPPNVNLVGLGFDVVTGKRRGSVINTRSFGGQCRTIFSGVHKNFYRLPLSTIQYNFLVKVQNDFSDEMFSSKWHYAKDVVNRETVTGTTKGYSNYDFHETHDTSQYHRLLVLKNDIEVVQFQSNSPQYIPIAEEFWKALAKLPSVYDYTAYRKVLERFGTHYVSQGTLGGFLKIIMSIDSESEKYLAVESKKFHECEKKVRFILIFPLIITKCKKGDKTTITPRGYSTNNVVAKVDVEGGGLSHSAALQRMQLDDASKNWEMYSNWADSIRSFPKIIKQKLRPLSELVKDVQCAGVKKLYLRRAIEQYRAENDPCHCQPCRNNGIAVMDGDECKCICKPGTSGVACEQGTEVEGQQGVIHGSWTCWSAWSTCSRGQRSRSRRCQNPAPQNGGQHCIGDTVEMSSCDEEDLEYLKTMEPQCFDNTLPPSQKCETPPALINGFIMNPKDVYLVGGRVEYSCIAGFHVLGNSILECSVDQTWSPSLGQCTASSCKLKFLNEEVLASPLKPSYDIGEAVTLSCPVGRTLQGEDRILCDSSLNFSPDPAEITCSQEETPPSPITPTVSCEAWEKPSRDKCICRIPHECSPSLDICGTLPGSGKLIPMTVCKMHALKCNKKNFEIAEYSDCVWPQRNTLNCSSCHMWEKCDDTTSSCRCKELAECLNSGINVCVRVGEDDTASTQTMSECEAGVRRCNGEKVSVVSILPCAS
ncbi:complement component C7 isoform X1 [Oryzias latipes]|uniref:complement component C7 isoform X1 n=1 Tax=Oryzias latipes TaxID=8090 RepID=UPI0002A4A013|nr:complement component C7 isoform X1 [Oryzias latipes]